MLPTTVRSASDLHLGGLIWTLVRTDFKTRYHGTVQGFIWALLKPMAMFVVLMTVFSFVFGAKPNYALELIIGLFLWDFFSDATKSAMMSLYVKSYLLTKARVPPWVFVVTSTSNALITLAAFGSILGVYLLIAGRSPGPIRTALFLYYMAHYFLIVTGIGLATSVLFLRYRDLNQVWDVVIQAGFFVSPVVYPLGIIPERFHKYLYLWAPTPIIQFSRNVLVDGTIPTARAHLFLAIGTGVIFLSGAAIYLQRARRVAEYV